MENIDLPAMNPFAVSEDGNFYAQSLPDAWKDALQSTFPLVWELLEKSNTYLAGGLLRSMVAEEPLSPEATDIDLFFNSDYTYQAVKKYLAKIDGMNKIFQCPEDKLVTFKDDVTGWKYQCIAVDFYPSLFSVVNSFDFTCTCFGAHPDYFIFHKDAISDALSKNLRWNKITYPSSSMRRMMKYARKGYTMAQSEYQYFVDCVSSHHPDIADYQLVYVD